MSISLSLQPLLSQPYKREIFQTILEDILPNGCLNLREVPMPISATCEHVTGVTPIGQIELPDGNTIALLEVHVADRVKLALNRVALRNFVARFIDEAGTSAVLAVFHQPNKHDWRLTFACKRTQLDEETLEITTPQTAPRRYTFLLGSNASCKTEAGRLREISTIWQNGKPLTLDDIENAFSVERLNIEFFDLYRALYSIFVSDLLPDSANIANAKHPYKKDNKSGKPNPFSHLIPAPNHSVATATRAAFGIPRYQDVSAQDKADKPIRDFVKRLLGRLVFLHFLQKKGWMGCPPKSKTWTGGNPEFLNKYFTLAECKGEVAQFHSKWLIPLFFEALNKDEDQRPGFLFERTGSRIPYLNGGLFETDPAPLHALDFPAELFRTLLKFFGQYHFTIDENDPEDHEVGIDPEMLGHIFENLLEDNKDKGAYYTPKAIVSYMARQSLLNYLQTHLGEHAELAQLLNEKDRSRLPTDGFVNKYADDIAELLKRSKYAIPPSAQEPSPSVYSRKSLE
jgi:hypothetical protein